MEKNIEDVADISNKIEKIRLCKIYKIIIIDSNYRNIMTMNKDILKQLQNAKALAGGTSLVTYYMPANSALWLASHTLTSELSTSQNIKSKSVKKGVQSALKMGIQRLKTCKLMKAPENGLVLCAGDIIENKSYI